MRTARPSFAALALLVVAACAPARPVLKRMPKAPVGAAWGFAVYPVGLRFRTTGYEAFKRGRELAEQLSALTGRTVYGPGEFTIDDFDAPDLRRGTNLMGALRYSKARRPEDFYGVRLLVDQRVTSVSAATFDAAGNPNGRVGRDATEVAVRLELLSLGERTIVTEIEGVASVDPFNIDPESDPWPDVTRLSAVLLEELVTQLGLKRDPPAEELGLTTVAVPGPALEYGTATLPSERDEQKELDALDRDARFYALVKRLDPDAPRTRIRQYRNAGHGLVVLAAEGRAAAAGLQPEDLILNCNGEAVTGRHVIDRHLAGGAAKLDVKRGGESVDITLR